MLFIYFMFCNFIFMSFNYYVGPPTPRPVSLNVTPTFPSRVLRPFSSPFLCLEMELPLAPRLPSFPLPVPLDSDVDDWLKVLFLLGISTLGVR